jgi:hypothetical protein
MMASAASAPTHQMRMEMMYAGACIQRGRRWIVRSTQSPFICWPSRR